MQPAKNIQHYISAPPPKNTPNKTHEDNSLNQE